MTNELISLIDKMREDAQILVQYGDVTLCYEMDRGREVKMSLSIGNPDPSTHDRIIHEIRTIIQACPYRRLRLNAGRKSYIYHNNWLVVSETFHI